MLLRCFWYVDFIICLLSPLKKKLDIANGTTNEWYAELRVWSAERFLECASVLMCGVNKNLGVLLNRRFEWKYNRNRCDVLKKVWCRKATAVIFANSVNSSLLHAISKTSVWHPMWVDCSTVGILSSSNWLKCQQFIERKITWRSWKTMDCERSKNSRIQTSIKSNVFSVATIFNAIFVSPSFSKILWKNRSENNSSNSDRVVAIDNGSQDDVWGQATSLLGQLGSVVVFNEALKETQMTMLYNAGEKLPLRVCAKHGDMWEREFWAEDERSKLFTPFTTFGVMALL